jgi:hypothetical protein
MGFSFKNLFSRAVSSVTSFVSNNAQDMGKLLMKSVSAIADGNMPDISRNTTKLRDVFEGFKNLTGSDEILDIPVLGPSSTKLEKASWSSIATTAVKNVVETYSTGVGKRVSLAGIFAPHKDSLKDKVAYMVSKADSSPKQAYANQLGEDAAALASLEAAVAQANAASMASLDAVSVSNLRNTLAVYNKLEALAENSENVSGQSDIANDDTAEGASAVPWVLAPNDVESVQRIQASNSVEGVQGLASVIAGGFSTATALGRTSRDTYLADKDETYATITLTDQSSFDFTTRHYNWYNHLAINFYVDNKAAGLGTIVTHYYDVDADKWVAGPSYAMQSVIDQGRISMRVPRYGTMTYIHLSIEDTDVATVRDLSIDASLVEVVGLVKSSTAPASAVSYYDGSEYRFITGSEKWASKLGLVHLGPTDDPNFGLIALWRSRFDRLALRSEVVDSACVYLAGETDAAEYSADTYWSSFFSPSFTFKKAFMYESWILNTGPFAGLTDSQKNTALEVCGKVTKELTSMARNNKDFRTLLVSENASYLSY